jgi:hypothetical protein
MIKGHDQGKDEQVGLSEAGRSTAPSGFARALF